MGSKTQARQPRLLATMAKWSSYSFSPNSHRTIRSELMTDLREHLKLAESLAAEAGKQSLDYFRRIQRAQLGMDERIEFVAKGAAANDTFSVADTESERIIVDGVNEAFPDAGILAEEGSGKKTKSGFTYV